MNIVAYTFDAAMHCPDCTRESAANGTLTRLPPLHRETDEHGICVDLIDSEGNRVGVVFDTDEIDEGSACNKCGERFKDSQDPEEVKHQVDNFHKERGR